MTDAVIDTGSYGAKVQSWRRANPRDLLKRLLEQNPSLSRNESCKLFLQAMRDDVEFDDYLATVVEYWHTNNYNSLIIEKATPQDREQRTKHRAAAVTAVSEKIKTKIRERAQLMWLEMVLPNEKELQDCTGRECLKMGPKVGKLLTKLGKTLKPSQTVGEVYKTNAALQKLLSS